MEKRITIPLRYPGSKTRLIDYFETLIEENALEGAHLFEPYAGSASVSINMLARKKIERATLIERDPLLYSFWKCVMNHTDDLCQMITDVPVTLATWNEYQKYLLPKAKKEYHIRELGMAGLFLNRTSFSGILHAGPIGGKSQSSKYTVDCRFNKERIVEQILNLSKFRGKISVVFANALSYLKGNTDRLRAGHNLVYLDPPYYVQGKRLYRHHYETKDHKKLADFIMRQDYPWIVSYDNHSDIRKMFSGAKIVPIVLNYVVKESRNADELLISKLELPPPIYKNFLGNSVQPTPHKRMRMFS